MNAHICTANNALSQLMVQVEYRPGAKAGRVVVTSRGGDDVLVAIEHVSFEDDDSVTETDPDAMVRLDVDSAATLGRYLVGLGESS